MKRIALLCLLVSLIVGSASGSISATKTGDWSDITVWNKGYVPIDIGGEEIKLTGTDGLTITVNSVCTNYTTQKIALGRDATLAVVNGGYIGNGREVKVGDTGASSSGTDIGYVTITTGGQFEMTGTGKMILGYKKDGEGYLTIDGGTLNGSGGRMYIGCQSADGSKGKLTVVGTGGTIALGGAMYIANNSTTVSDDTGTGIIEFQLNSSGLVSEIEVAETIIDSMDEPYAAVAKLIVDGTLGLPTAPIVLIRNTGTSDVVGHFDDINGYYAGEGSYVNIGGNIYLITYQYDADGDSENNDIALIIPEPATLTLLGIGGLVVAKRRKR